MKSYKTDKKEVEQKIKKSKKPACRRQGKRF
jgi:hypothetical protein